MTPVEELPPRDEREPPTLAIASLGLCFGIALECLALNQMGHAFAAMFEDFEATLPFLTRLFIGGLGYVFAVLLALGGTAASGLGWLLRRRGLQIAGLGFVIAVAIVLPLVAVVGFYQPLWQLAGNIR